VQIIQDLKDTAEAHKENCLGLAANQIGYNKKVILVKDGDSWTYFINPVISLDNRDKRAGKFMSEEGCLSLEGTRTVERWNRITLRSRGIHGNIQELKHISKPYSVILQHETDHTNGIII
jgi:peptide deformylase